MKKILLALGLLALPAAAQTITAGSDPYGGITGNLAASNDAVQLSLQGARWATARFSVSAAGTAALTSEVTIDGVNWTAAAFAKRLDAVSANPTVSGFSGSTVAVGQIFEVPLPSNAATYRLRVTTPGTTSTVTVYGGLPYAPGAPVTGVIFDTTSAVNTAIDTGTLDLSGWEYASASYTTPAGGSGTISMVDDAGTSVTMFTPPASAGAWYPFVTMSPSVSQVTALPATGSTGALPIQKRMRFQSIAVAALTSRIRIEVRR